MKAIAYSLICLGVCLNAHSHIPIMDEQQRITLTGNRIPLAPLLRELAALKGLNMTLNGSIHGEVDAHWHKLPWIAAMHTLKKDHNLSIEADPYQWHIHQHNEQWYTIELNHLTKKALQQANIQKHLSTNAKLLLPTNQPIAWLWGSQEDQTILNRWNKQLQQHTTPIKIQVYCLLLNKHGLHDFGLSSSMQTTLAPDDWSTLLHKPAWLSMLKRLKSWGIERLLTHWMSDTEKSGHGLLLAQPYITTLPGEEACIETGIRFPIQQKNSRGSIGIAYHQTSIALKTTPFLNPDGSITLSLDITYDWPTSQTQGPPIIQTRKLHTQSILQPQHTWIAGGILQRKLQLQQENDLTHWPTAQEQKEQTQALMIMVVPSQS